MRSYLSKLCLIGLLALSGASWAAPATAVPGAANMSQQEAARLLSVLENPQARQQAIATLRVLARQAPDSNASAALASPDASGVVAGEQPAEAPASAELAAEPASTEAEAARAGSAIQGVPEGGLHGDGRGASGAHDTAGHERGSARSGVASVLSSLPATPEVRTIERVLVVPASAASAPPAPASGASAAEAASAAEPASNALVTSNGLTAQLIHQVGRWSDTVSDQITRVGQAVVELPQTLRWWRSALDSPAKRQRALTALWQIVLLAVVAALAEQIVMRLLRKPRHGLRERASRADARAEQEAEARAEARARAAAETPPAPGAVHDAAMPRTETAADVLAEGVETHAALVRAADGAARPASGTGQAKQAGDSAAEEDADLTDAQARAIEENRAERERAAAAARPEPAVAPAPAAPAPLPHHAQRNRRLLRHLPVALAVLLLDLAPLLIFVAIVMVCGRWLTGGRGPIDAMVDSLLVAYVTVRVVMGLTRLVVSPDAPSLRLVRINDAGARYAVRWMRVLAVIAVFGRTSADVAQAFGVGVNARIALLKLLGLILHACLLVIIVQTRHGVSRWLRGERKGRFAGMRGWLAEVWPFLAGFFVIGVWVVYALGVEDGVPKLLHFIGATAVVVIAARVLAVLILGGLARLFEHQDKDPVTGALIARRSDRYYPLVRAAVTAVLIVASVLALFEAWGLHAWHWLTHGAIGRHLASAALTIAIAAVVAVLVWEGVNVGVERRLQRWRDNGEVVRAARLRTLLPMFRTLLFIAIAMIVGLTALNEIGVNTTPLLAGASLIGVALSLGSQKLIQDFVTGIFLLMENAMQVGDWVTVAGVSGSVEYLSIRTVRLRAGDGSLHTVPFSSVSTVNNVNRGLGNAAVRVSVGYDEDLDRVSQVLQDIAQEMRADPKFKDAILNDLELWGVDAVTGATITLAGQIRARDSGRWGVQREFNRRMVERFRELGITLYNPDARALSAKDLTIRQAGSPAVLAQTASAEPGAAGTHPQ